MLKSHLISVRKARFGDLLYKFHILIPDCVSRERQSSLNAQHLHVCAWLKQITQDSPRACVMLTSPDAGNLERVRREMPKEHKCPILTRLKDVETCKMNQCLASNLES